MRRAAWLWLPVLAAAIVACGTTAGNEPKGRPGDSSGGSGGGTISGSGGSGNAIGSGGAAHFDFGLQRAQARQPGAPASDLE